MPIKVTLDDDKEYIEYSFVEIEQLRLNAEINRQVKYRRPTRSKSIFEFPQTWLDGKKNVY